MRLFYYLSTCQTCKRIMKDLDLDDSIQKIVILSVFLMPSSLVEINFVNYLTMFINKISVYTLGFIILNIFYQDLKNNLFKKEPGSSSNKI